MRQRIASVLAVALLLAAGWWANDRRRPTVEEPEPEEAVWQMLVAARAGEVEVYLGHFAGELAPRLAAVADQMGRDRFAAYLRTSVSELKGMAIYDVERPGNGEAALVVEYVYAEESERQRLRLRRFNGEWRIVATSTGLRRRSLIPYGTPIEELE